jgi:hypothetical protein
MRCLAVPLLLAAAMAFADLPMFATPFFVQDGGTDLVVNGSIPDPCVYDWDGDGVKDLVLGQFAYGYVRFYRNIGSNASPVFNGYSWVYAGGSQISVSYG